MPPTHLKTNGDSDEVYQIRLKNELKSKFMTSCRQLALNPSAVVRMLMEEWTKKNQTDQNAQERPTTL